MHVAAHIPSALVEIEKDVSHELAGAVIGVLPSPSRAVNGQAGRVQEVFRLRAGSRRVERRMLQKPDKFRRASREDSGGAVFHRQDGRLIGDRRLTEAPLDARHLPQSVRMGTQLFCESGDALIHIFFTPLKLARASLY